MNIILDNIIGKKVYIIYVILKYIKEESNLVIKERKISLQIRFYEYLHAMKVIIIATKMKLEINALHSLGKEQHLFGLIRVV